MTRSILAMQERAPDSSMNQAKLGHLFQRETVIIESLGRWCRFLPVTSPIKIPQIYKKMILFAIDPKICPSNLVKCH